MRLSRSTLELLAKEDELNLIVDGQDTSTGDTTENVGTSTLEERLDTFRGNNLLESIKGSRVLDGLYLVSMVADYEVRNKTCLARGHHHTTTDSIQRIRADTST